MRSLCLYYMLLLDRVAIVAAPSYSICCLISCISRFQQCIFMLDWNQIDHTAEVQGTARMHSRRCVALANAPLVLLRARPRV
ncbi:hypothetical protein L226DRAFT_77381 [Lentinus tigrinus ALCF2SS1-7]|uniref:uncharacterized protein n=1 Tax=Lentinus tigrinus ALCF2SS1-7 TaxID=1328758 RepID=UPI001166187D|nr:hypothetical protein L226DRAFT_77381 [Lentinus tigrinus ALCF2SS1-7]